MAHTNEELQEMLKNKQMSSHELETLLEARESGDVKFTLVDIREVYEFESSSIDGTDLLIPTSVIQGHLDKFETRKEEVVILYCRTGNRTGQVMGALERMGHEKVVHLSHGIVAYAGSTSHKVEIPNQL